MVHLKRPIALTAVLALTTAAVSNSSPLAADDQGNPTGVIGGKLAQAKPSASAGAGTFEAPAPQSQQLIEQTAAKVIRRFNIQADAPGDRGAAEWRIKLPDFDLGLWALWAALAAGVGAGVYSIRDQLGIWSGPRTDGWQDALAEGGRRSEAGSLADVSTSADELAAKGLYMEAIHLLLLRSLGEMRMRLETQFADSLTSREIVRAAELPTEGRSALQDIVSRVELTYFGEVPAGADDYAACRASFEKFVHLLETGRAR